MSELEQEAEDELTPFEYPDMAAFWEFIKAQGTQVARVWDECKDKEAVRAIAPSLGANLDALLKGSKVDVAIDGEPSIFDKATTALHSTPCPGCGLEPDVVSYYRDTATKVRRGYHCECGAVVIDGVVQTMGMR